MVRCPDNRLAFFVDPPGAVAISTAVGVPARYFDLVGVKNPDIVVRVRLRVEEARPPEGA
jgi:hypothetical protein